MTKYLKPAIFLVAFIYYCALSSTQFTWVFGSGDSGGWLASALTWVPPQPLGNPLYVLFGHLMATLPGDLVAEMTILGSCLPSAVTVVLVYSIVLHYTQSRKIGLLSAGVLLASTVFLAQSTVLGQYPLAVMLTVLAFWFYLKDKRKLAVLCLGLGTAMHFVVAVVSVVWLALEWRQGRLGQWARLIPIFVVSGVLPYALTLWQLWRYYGELNSHVISSFVSNTSGAGGLVVMLFPMRLLRYAAWITVSLGVALVPIYFGVRYKVEKGFYLLVTPIVFVSWYYLTAQDPTVWHYLPWVMPFLAILAGVGLTKMGDWRPAVPVVGAWVGVMLLVNAAFFNAGVEARRYPVASTFYDDLVALPENARVVADRLGPGATVRYVIADRRPDIECIPSAEMQEEADRGYSVYVIDIDTLEVSRWEG